MSFMLTSARNRWTHIYIRVRALSSVRDQLMHRLMYHVHALETSFECGWKWPLGTTFLCVCVSVSPFQYVCFFLYEENCLLLKLENNIYLYKAADGRLFHEDIPWVNHPTMELPDDGGGGDRTLIHTHTRHSVASILKSFRTCRRVCVVSEHSPDVASVRIAMRRFPYAWLYGLARHLAELYRGHIPRCLYMAL